MRILVCVSIIAVFAAFVQAQYKSKRTAELFSATAMNGQNFDLESLKGKVVVMTFWSTQMSDLCQRDSESQSSGGQLQGKRCRIFRFINGRPEQDRADF